MKDNLRTISKRRRDQPHDQHHLKSKKIRLEK